MPGLELSSPRTLAPALLLFLGVGIGALYAADGPPAQGIPYQGRLELAGQPYTGTQTLSFRIWDGPDVGSATMLHEEEQSPAVRNGAFGVVLGDGGLPDALFTSDALYLQIGVGALPSPNWLAGTQRILPAAQSVRAGRAYNFDVEGPVLSGPTDFTITNGTAAVRMGNGNPPANNTQGDVAVVVGNGSELTVTSVAGDDRLVVSSTQTHATGDLRVDGTVTVGGALRLGVHEESCPVSGPGPQDCYCDTGEMVLGGGTRGSNNNRITLRETRPIYDATLDRHGWRVACMVFFSTGSVVFADGAECAGPVTVTCARLQPD